MAVRKKAVAKKKAAPKASKAVAKRQSTSIADMRAQMAQEVASIQDRIGAPATNNISIKNGEFTFPDGSIVRDSIDVVIVDFICRNMYYDKPWKEGVVTPPACWAINKVPAALTPSNNVVKRQAPKGKSCADCSMNQFGSDGDGKACKNQRVLAVLLPDAAPDDPIMTIVFPPTAMKPFDGYVSSVSRLFQVPPVGVITQIGFHPEKTYPLPLCGNPRPNERVEDFFMRRPEAEIALTAEPDPNAA